jgi:transcriptional regulator with XRE-family HTH domain
MEQNIPKAQDKSFSSVTEMLKDSGVEGEILDAVEEVRHQQVANELAKMRVAKGLTQKQMAALIGCTQGRISKLETGRDEDLTLKDLLDYAKATDSGFQIGIGPRLTLAESVKYHVFALKRNLDELVKLANKGDDEIIKGIENFLEQVVFNLAFRLGQCLKSMPKRKSPDVPEIEVISSMELGKPPTPTRASKQLVHA